MKFILVACLIIAAANIAHAYDEKGLIAALVDKFTSTRVVEIKAVTVDVENQFGEAKTCKFELVDEPSPGVPIKFTMECPGEDKISKNIYMNFSDYSTYPYYYYDESGQKVALYIGN